MNYFELLEQKELDRKFIHHNWFKHFDIEKGKWISFKSKKDALRVIAFCDCCRLEMYDDVSDMSLSEVMLNSNYPQYGLLVGEGGSYKLRGIELDFYIELLKIKKEYDKLEADILSNSIYKNKWIFGKEKENIYNYLKNKLEGRNDLIDVLDFKLGKKF